MAGMTPEEEQQQKQFMAALAAMGKEINSAAEEYKKLSKIKLSEIKDAQEFAKAQHDLDQALKRLRQELTEKVKPSIKDFGKELFTGKQNFKSLSSEIDALDDAIKNAADNNVKNTLKAERNELQNREQRNRAAAELKTFTYSFGKTITSGAADAVGGLIKGLQGNASGTELAAGMMGAAVDVAAGGAKALGAGASAVGTTMMSSTNPRVKALGMAANVAGMAVGAFAEGASKLAKFGIEVLSKEVEKTVAAFGSMSASGAMFANGMQGMRDASGEAGLTVEQMSKVVSEHSGAIAAAGFGMTEGVRKVGGALKAGGDGMKRQMLNLGYSFEEQAGLVADTMQQMRGSGGPLKATDTEVAAQTQRYAENLRTIAAITGEDAKKKSEQVKQQANQLAFQQKIAGMEPAQRAKIIDAMKNMSDMERKNFMDMVNFGAVVNKEGAAMQAMSGGLSGAVQEYYQAFQQGTLDDKKARDISAQFADQQRQDYLGNAALGAAGAANVGGLAQSLAESMGKELEYRNIWTKEAIDAAQNNVQAQKDTYDPLTQSVNEAAVAAQDLKLKMQELMDVPIKNFAKVSEQMLEASKKLLESLGLGKGGDGKEQGPSTWERLKTAGAKAMEWGTTGAVIGGAVGGGVLSVPSAVIGGVGGAVAGALTDWFSDQSGKATGGIASGPTSGYLEKLHGTEAVIPTVGGKVPVDVRMKQQDPMALASANQEVISASIGKGFGSFGGALVSDLSNSFASVKQPTVAARQDTTEPNVGFKQEMARLDAMEADAKKRWDDAYKARGVQPVDFKSADIGAKMFDSMQVAAIKPFETMDRGAKVFNDLQMSNISSQFQSTEKLRDRQFKYAGDLTDAQMKSNLEKRREEVNAARMQSQMTIANLDKQISSTDELKLAAKKFKDDFDQKDKSSFGGLDLQGTAVGAALGTAMLPGIGTILGGALGKLQDKSKEGSEEQKSMASSALSSVTQAFSDQGIIGNFFKEHGTSMMTGASVGAIAGGPVGAVLGSLGGLVSGFIGDKAAEKQTVADNKSSGVEKTPEKRRPSEELLSMNDSMKQMVLIGQQQIQQQREMLDQMNRQVDISTRIYQTNI